MIQYMTICCLCHSNVIMPSAMWLELSNSRVAILCNVIGALKFDSGSVPNDKNVTHNIRPFSIHIREGLGTRLVLNVLCCSWSLHVEVLVTGIENCWNQSIRNTQLQFDLRRFENQVLKGLRRKRSSTFYESKALIPVTNTWIGSM